MVVVAVVVVDGIKPVVWRGVVWCGVAWRGVAWRDVVRRDVVRRFVYALSVGTGTLSEVSPGLFR